MSDESAPILAGVPNDTAVSCNAIPQLVVVTATDNCDQNPAISFSEMSTQGSDPDSCSFYNYTITRTWTATDACGNSSTATQTITVSDETGPVLTCPTPQSVYFTDEGECYAELSFSATALDNCADDVSVTYSIGGQEISFPYQFPVGTATVSVVAVDVCGNTSTCSFTVVVVDNENPTINCPAPQILLLGDNCSATLPDYTEFASGIDDNCGVESVVQSPAPGTTVTGDGPLQVTLTVTDVNGNTATCSFPVNRIDLVPPTLTCFDGSVTFNGQTTIPLNVDALADADDNCELASVTINPTVINCIQLGQVVPVLVTATDAFGNASTCISNITVGGLPCGWKFEPGAVGCGGAVTFDPPTGVWTANAVNCFYANPWTTDQFIFAQRTLCGDGSITARVTDISGNAFGWAGVTMRETTALGSKKAQLTTNRSNFSRREFRTVTNGPAQPQQFPSGNRYWLRLVRTGNSFTGFVSPDGVAWFLVMAQSIPMNQCIEVGLVVTNYQQVSSVTATFDNVSTTGSNTPLIGMPTDPQTQLREITSAPEFSVFPNPTSGELTIDVSQYVGRAVRIELYSMQGQLLRFAEVDEVQHPVELMDLSAQASGAYMIRIKSAGLPDAAQRVILSKMDGR